MFNLFGLTIVLTLTNICLAQDKSCKASELERKLTPLIGIFGIKEVKFAENEQDMQQWCRTIQREHISAKNYIKKCLNGLSKTIMSVTVYSADKVNTKLFCNNKAERNNFMSRARCGNRGKKTSAKCWTDLIDNITNVKNVSESKMKIPLFCCSFYTWKTCTMDGYKSIGSPICPESAIEGIDQHISRASLDPLNIFCSEYDDESDKCEKIMKDLPNIKSNRGRNKTPFPAIIEVFDTL